MSLTRSAVRTFPRTGARIRPFVAVSKDETAIENVLKNYKGMSFPHSVDIAINWGDMDALGHVNNSKYFQYFQQCRIDFLSAKGLSAYDREASEGCILAETTARFKQPVEYPDTVTVASRAERAVIQDDKDTLCESSWYHHYVVISHKTKKVVAEGQANIVNYDFVNKCRTPFSPKMLRLLFNTDDAEKYQEHHGAPRWPTDTNDNKPVEVTAEQAHMDFQSQIAAFAQKKKGGRPAHVPARKPHSGQ